MRSITDRTGQIFGQLTVVKLAARTDKYIRWECLCSCGNTKIAVGDDLKKGSIKSCGCAVNLGFTKHNHRSRLDQPSKTYQTWRALKSRCDNPKTISYQYYGAEGATYDPSWKDFEVFLADMGERPEGKTLNRLKRDLPYSKDNCEWATAKEQANDRRNTILIEHAGKTQSLMNWCAELKLDSALVRDRLRRGKTFEEAISTPKREW